jgi:hypothetical protein
LCLNKTRQQHRETAYLTGDQQHHAAVQRPAAVLELVGGVTQHAVDDVAG